MESKNEGLEDDFPVQTVFFYFPGCITTMLLVFIAGKYQMIIVLNEHVLL